jgi:hypothetical protein
MSLSFPNTSLSFIVQEIEDVLKDYPHYPYQTAFSMGELRQKLVDRVFHRLSEQETAYQPPESPQNPTILSHSLEGRVRLTNLIRDSIFYVLQENADWIKRHLPHQETATAQKPPTPQITTSVEEPSHWFG